MVCGKKFNSKARETKANEQLFSLWCCLLQCASWPVDTTKMKATEQGFRVGEIPRQMQFISKLLTVLYPGTAYNVLDNESEFVD